MLQRSSPWKSSGLAPDVRHETLTESREAEIVLSPDEQALLEGLGRQLARGTDRFGQLVEASTSTLVRCSRVDPVHCKVTVADAVGVLAIPSLQIVVEPKIPVHHVLYLF